MFNYYFKGGYGYANYNPSYYVVVLKCNDKTLVCKKYRHFFFAKRKIGKLFNKYQLVTTRGISKHSLYRLECEKGYEIELTRW